MLQYFPKMKLIAFALGCGIPIAIALIYWLVFGGTIGVNLAGMVVLALLIFGPILTFNVFNRKADARFEGIMNLYNEQCNPQAFIDEAEPLVARFTEPYGPFEAWFLSFYALALLDVDRTEEAAIIGKKMQDFALNTQNPDEKLGLLVNILPLVLRLFGPQAGMNIISQAQALINENPTPNNANQANYLESQRQMVQAVIDNDAEYLLSRCKSIREDEAGVQQMRVRVLEAHKEAQIRELQGDFAGARECWEFVRQYGNCLPCVKEAEQRLA